MSSLVRNSRHGKASANTALALVCERYSIRLGMSTATLSAVTHRTDLGAEGPSSAVPESLLAELQSVPVARDAASTAELECVLQQRLVAAHPSAPHELREHLLRLEEQATQLEALQAERPPSNLWRWLRPFPLTLTLLASP